MQHATQFLLARSTIYSGSSSISIASIIYALEVARSMATSKI